MEDLQNIPSTKKTENDSVVFQEENDETKKNGSFSSLNPSR